MPSLLVGAGGDPGLTRFYRKALDRRHHETVTSQFWTSLFQDWFRFHRGIYVNSQQAPSPGSRKRIDAVIEISTQQGVVPMLYVEFKRAGRPRTSRDEAQVTNYCMEMLQSSGKRHMRAMICYGPVVKSWVVRRQGATSRVVDFTDAQTDTGGEIALILDDIVHQHAVLR